MGTALQVISACCVLAASQAGAAELVLTFDRLQPGGQVSVAIFDRASAWDQRAAPAWSRIVPVKSAEVRLPVDLPAGRYAVMAYHDRDGDGRLDTLPVGLPTEPYGFSNNSRGVFGPPKWNAAVFELKEPGAQQAIRLR